jgi:hypothetical protein
MSGELRLFLSMCGYALVIKAFGSEWPDCKGLMLFSFGWICGSIVVNWIKDKNHRQAARNA